MNSNISLNMLVTLTLIAVLFIGGSNNLLSIEEMAIISAGYVAMKLSFYTMLFSLKTDEILSSSFEILKQRAFAFKELS